MVKFLTYLLFICSIYNAYSQSFLNDDNYAYGEGISNTIEDADKKALKDLAISLKAQIKASSIYRITDNNGEIKDFYTESINISSNLIIKDSYKYIDTVYNGYKVYRYINKKEYVESRLSIYNNIINTKVNYNNSLNLVLGEYFYAYKILDDDLMALFYHKTNDLKNNLKAKIINLQKDINIEETTSLYFNIKKEDIPLYGKDYQNIDNNNFDINHIYLLIKEPYAYNLDFEYWDGEKWSNDYEKSLNNPISNLCRISCNDLIPRNKYTLYNFPYYKEIKNHKELVLKKQLKFRVVFQTLDINKNKIKIEVPDDFYVINEVNMALKEDIYNWIKKDIERGFLSQLQANRILYYLYQ